MQFVLQPCQRKAHPFTFHGKPGCRIRLWVCHLNAPKPDTIGSDDPVVEQQAWGWTESCVEFSKTAFVAESNHMVARSDATAPAGGAGAASSHRAPALPGIFSNAHNRRPDGPAIPSGRRRAGLLPGLSDSPTQCCPAFAWQSDPASFSDCTVHDAAVRCSCSFLPPARLARARSSSYLTPGLRVW